MRRNRPGRASRIPIGRGRAVTFAGRISATGTAAAVVVCLAAVLIAGNSVLHGVRRVAIPRPPRPEPVTPRISPTQTPVLRRPARAPVTVLLRDVRQLVGAQDGAAARRDYGTAAVGQPVVQVTRTAQGQSWAFGTAVIPVPAGSAAPPQTVLFVAHARGGGWHIALSGTVGFDRLLRSAAGTVVTAAEESVLMNFSAAQAAPPGAGATQGGAALALPWQTGQSWRFIAAFSGSAAGNPLASMLAFAGGDGRVRAAGPGLIYRFCGGPGTDALLEIIHPDGTATEYYQLRAETWAADGSYVAAGSYLGMTGTSLACGGAVLGPGSGKAKKAGRRAGVVAFAVIGAGGTMGVDGLVIGGWTFHERGTPPSAWAQRAAVRVKLGGSLMNFGTADQSAPTASPPPVPTPGPSPSVSPHAVTQPSP